VHMRAMTLRGVKTLHVHWRPTNEEKRRCTPVDMNIVIAITFLAGMIVGGGCTLAGVWVGGRKR